MVEGIPDGDKVFDLISSDFCQGFHIASHEKWQSKLKMLQINPED